MKTKKINKRSEDGFTLVELLAVIIILVTVLVVALPSIGKTLENLTKNQNKETNEILKNAASMYLQERKELTKSLYDKEVGFTIIKVANLINEGFLNENILENKEVKKSTSIKASLDKDNIIEYSFNEVGRAYIAFDNALVFEYGEEVTNEKLLSGIRAYQDNGQAIEIKNDNVTINGEVNTLVPGDSTISYTLKYIDKSCIDEPTGEYIECRNGEEVIINTIDQTIRRVKVRPSKFDIVEITGTSPLTVVLNSTVDYYNGVTVTYRDGSTADLTSSMPVQINNKPSTSSPSTTNVIYTTTRSDRTVYNKNRTVVVNDNLGDNIVITSGCKNESDGCWFIGPTANNYIKFDSDGNNVVNSLDKMWRVMRVDPDKKIQVILDIPVAQSKYADGMTCCNSGCYYPRFLNGTGTVIDNHLLDNLNSNQVSKYVGYYYYNWCDGPDENECGHKVSSQVALIRSSEYAKIANNNYSNNWLILSSYKWWTMTGYGKSTSESHSSSDHTHFTNRDVAAINTNGLLFVGNFTVSYYIRPVIYLDSNNKITSGTGTSTNPYIVKIK